MKIFITADPNVENRIWKTGTYLVDILLQLLKL